MTGRLVDMAFTLGGKQRVTLELNGDFWEIWDKLHLEPVLDVEIKKHREKRSLSANAYFHVLCNKISAETGESEDVVKRRLVVSYGALARDKDGKPVGLKLPPTVDPCDFYPYRMEGKQDELFTGPTLQKIEDMMEYAYPVLQQFPKSEKFAMAADMKLVMDVMLEKAVEAQKKYFKKTTLQELDVANTKLQHYLRVAFRLRFVSMHKYEVWSKQLVEIGKLLGSWLNTVKANSKT